MDKSKNDLAKKLIFEDLVHADTFMRENIDCITKDSEFSQSLRRNGNEMYFKRDCDKEYEEIHEYYSRSIAFAPVDSYDLALAYGNRSALLHRIQKHEDSILDIDRALQINQSDITFRVKLLCRKVECLAALGSSKAQQVYNEAEYLLPKIMHMNKNEKILENMKKADIAVKSLNPTSRGKDKEVPEHMSILKKKEMQNPFDSVNAQYNGESSKHLVATRDIKPGEIVFVEKPYVGCINSNKGHFYCGHCFVKTWASIPCDFCNWCMYCSKRCKDIAWMSYHDTECYVVSYLVTADSHVDYPYQLSLRSLIMGVKESGGISNFVADIKTVDEWTGDQIYFNCILSNGFRSIYSLCKEIPEDIMKAHVNDAILILVILCKYTQFFGPNKKFEDINDIQKNHEAVFIGSVLLKLWSRSNSSLHTVHESNSSCKRSIGTIKCDIATCTKGACMPSLSFFIDHSCYPNVKRCVTDDYKVIVFSLLPIKKNSKLMMAYQQPFFEAPKFARQKRLFHSPDAECYCEACKFNWPTLKELWTMPKDNPKLYIENYNKLESDMFDKYDKLVRPIIINCQKTSYNQAKVRKIANAIEDAVSCLQQPSIVICELMTCLCLIFEKLYCSDS